MVRRGQQGKRALNRAKKKAEAVVASDQGEYAPPPRQKCEERCFDKYVDDEATIRIVVRQWRLNGSMVDFALTLELMTLTDEGVEWVAFTRVDCCHGYAHGHGLIGPAAARPPAPIMRLDSPEDVPVAFSASIVQIGDVGIRLRNQEGTPWMS